MKFLLSFSICLFITLNSYAQLDSAKRKYADTEAMILKYRASCQKAWDNKEDKLAESYYDSIRACITHSYVKNYKFETISGKQYTVGASHKPIFLTVSATWCVPCRAEIPALNKIVDDYCDKVDFIVLFWDVKKDLSKLAPQYNRKIYLVPSLVKSVDENHIIDIDGFRNINGYPSMFLINTSNEIVDFHAGAIAPGVFPNGNGGNTVITKQDAFKGNYQTMKKRIDLLLNSKNN